MFQGSPGVLSENSSRDCLHPHLWCWTTTRKFRPNHLSTKSSRSPHRKAAFLDKAHYQVIWKADGTGAGDCLKTFTMKNGDKVFAPCEGKPTPTGNEGTVTLVGGTGPYAGIKGKGSFKLTTVSDRVMWDILEWDYEVP